MTDTAPEKAPPRILALAIAACAVVMMAGMGGGIIALTRLDFLGAGACLLAAGVAAGLLANAVLRS